MTLFSFSRSRMSAVLFASSLVAAVSLGGAELAQAGTTISMPASAAVGPPSVADLAEGLLDAVVNISTSQNVKDDQAQTAPVPQVPQGSPFQDLFDDFFKGKGKGGRGHTVSSLGSGFVVDPAGYIVTNNHVIEGADEIEVIFAKGDRLKAKLVGTDTKTDISLLKVEPKTPLTAVHFGDSRSMRIGDWVMAIGNPFGLGGTVTVGIISARGRNINAGPYDNFIQTDAAINKGNSGGPLFNMKGEVIGINTAIISPSGGSIGLGFSIPADIATNVVDQLRQYGQTRRGWLGVRIQPVTEELISSLDLKEVKGALVAGIIEGGPVEKGPIKAGDVIVSFDGHPVNEMRDLPRIVAESPIGRPVKVDIIRKGEPMTVDVVLARMEEDDKQDTADATTKPDAAKPTDKTEPTPKAPDAAQPTAILGMSIEPLTSENRKARGIGESVEGVLITQVAPGSPAAQKGLKAGDVVVEVAQDFVNTPEALRAKINTLRESGRRNAHLMIASPNGDLRFVAVPLE